MMRILSAASKLAFFAVFLSVMTQGSAIVFPPGWKVQEGDGLQIITRYPVFASEKGIYEQMRPPEVSIKIALLDRCTNLSQTLTEWLKIGCATHFLGRVIN